MSSARSAQLGIARTPRSNQVSSAGFDYEVPPISEGHNSFVQTLFQMFLDSMEILLSQDSIHIYAEKIGCQVELGQVCSAQQASSARLNLTTCDQQLW